jgi:hypothetical protein
MHFGSYYPFPELMECGKYAERRGAYSGLVGNVKERDHLEGLGMDRKIILTAS